MTIRNANTSDISIIQDLAEKTWWPTYSPILTNEQIRYMLDLIYSTEALTRVMEDGSQQFILLSDERGEQAFAAYGPRKEEKSVSKLHKIYVLPDNQGKGYGKVLINEIIQRILKENNHALDLNVNRYNPAISFYQKLGFQVIREENIAIGPYWMNDFVMRKEI
jgi:GNAT superfamily N-acetyltransferase